MWYVYFDQECNLSDNWGRGGGGLFIYLCYARRISFEINSNSKEMRRAEHEYINKHPPSSYVPYFENIPVVAKCTLFRPTRIGDILGEFNDCIFLCRGSNGC